MTIIAGLFASVFGRLLGWRKGAVSAVIIGVFTMLVGALLSVNAGNRRGLPDAETLQVLAGYTVLRTDRNGWIEISTDGQRMWVEVERK